MISSHRAVAGVAARLATRRAVVPLLKGGKPLVTKVKTKLLLKNPLLVTKTDTQAKKLRLQHQACNNTESQHMQQLTNDAGAVIWTMACCPLQSASQAMRNCKEVVMRACYQKGFALKYASQELQNDKEVVLAACSQNGMALLFASETLRADKEVVMAAVASNPGSLQFALGGLNQDKDCLIRAGLWDHNHDGTAADATATYATIPLLERKKIVLSTKFSLSAESSPHATNFTVALKNNPYIAEEEFVVYSPNAFSKGTCDPNWTDKKWPCRGTHDSCQKPAYLKMGIPQETSECCWRYSYRHHLEESARLGGFMIQVVDRDYRKGFLRRSSSNSSSECCSSHDLYELHTLGEGQTIEIEMAQDIGIKIFRFFEPTGAWSSDSFAKEVDQFVTRIQQWYQEGCSDMTVCNHFPEG